MRMISSACLCGYLKDHGPSAISDIQAITQANRNTIKVRLRELVADGYLIKQGKGKGTVYLIGDRSPYLNI